MREEIDVCSGMAAATAADVLLTVGVACGGLICVREVVDSHLMRAVVQSGTVVRQRRNGAVLDYVLVLAATFPVLLIVTVYGKRMMALVWEMLCVQVSWPFL